MASAACFPPCVLLPAHAHAMPASDWVISSWCPSLSLFHSPSFAVRIFDLRSSELVGSTQHTRSRLAGGQAAAQRLGGAFANGQALACRF